jgi:hypothetical protein
LNIRVYWTFSHAQRVFRWFACKSPKVLPYCERVLEFEVIRLALTIYMQIIFAFSGRRQRFCSFFYEITLGGNFGEVKNITEKVAFNCAHYGPVVGSSGRIHDGRIDGAA